ncbi:hypothetical protein GCM10023083_26440 [Streptomyces phyllanthi]
MDELGQLGTETLVRITGQAGGRDHPRILAPASDSAGRSRRGGSSPWSGRQKRLHRDAALASDWGVTDRALGKTVWAELPVP